MVNISTNTTVNREEADALKAMIFKRARERAEAMNKDVQDSYTSTMQNDIMDLARASFVASKNPFSLNEKREKENTEIKEQKTEEIGFSPRRNVEKKVNAEIKNKIADEIIIKNTVEANMIDARNTFNKKSTFLGALDFLNSQASISLIKTREKKFEALA